MSTSRARPSAVAASAVAACLLLLPLPGAGTPPPLAGGAGPGPGRPAPGRSQVAAPAVPVTPDVDRRSHARWRWPVTPPRPVLRPFVAPASRYAPGHRGLDLAAAVGNPVLAVEDGLVTHAGRVAGRGTVTVAHTGGLSSTYEPVRARVVAGTVVRAGSVLGVLEASSAPHGGHCLLTPCLHLGARRGEAYLDPMLLLGAGRVRLLPPVAGQVSSAG